MRCTKVYISCRGKRRIPYWREVYRGFELDGCRVTFTVPAEKCYLSAGTKVEFVPWHDYEVLELTSNVKIVEKTDSGKAKVYLYSKRVYDELRRLYIEPMIRGEVPISNGIILAGPPGVGKSTFARIVARIIGVTTIDISPDRVLSEYVGRSEKNIRELLEQAKRSEPSVVILDDAEWILQARKLAGGHEHSHVLLDIQNILFNEMQAIADEKRRILFIASTNIKPSEIDPAFLRPGRFGDVIFVPLPDYEAVFETLKSMGVPEREADALARKAVNMGFSMADVIDMAARVRSGLPPKRKPLHGRGYARVIVDPVDGFEKIFDYFPAEAFKRRSRIYMYLLDEVGVAIATQIAYALKKPIIRLIDIRYFDEAAYTANTLEAIMIVPTSVSKEIQEFLDSNVDASLVLVGKEPPKIPAFFFFSLSELKNVLGKERIIDAVLKYKGISVTDELRRKIMNTVQDVTQLEAFLETVCTLSHIDESLLSKLAYYRKH